MSGVMRTTRMLQKVQQPAVTARLALRPTGKLAMRSSDVMAMRRTPSLLLQSTRRAMMPVPKEEHSAHTISQRLRTLKKIPIELLPLAFVLAVAIIAAVWSLGHKLYVDRSLRLNRKSGGH